MENEKENKLKAAMELARQMDEQTQATTRLDKLDQAAEFLEPISGVESSFGKNTNHRQITSGMHKGHRAIGKVGQMPNTINETINRINMNPNILPEEQELVDEANALQNLSPEELKSVVESNPQLEDYLAQNLASHVLDKQGGDLNKAAYSWLHGHNLKPEIIEKRNYMQDDYVKKFNKFQKILNMLDNKK